MELRTFISETLKDIMGGVHDAQTEVEFGEIVPHTNENLPVIETGLTSFQSIDFEVSVNVVAAVINGNVKGNSSNSSGHSAVLNFKVPVKMPVHPEPVDME
ncbi:hypothetical protein WOB98_22325 [Vibrio parahaemolyticus]|nr:hypothetical protein [Vibrio parahaemolyticus]